MISITEIMSSQFVDYVWNEKRVEWSTIPIRLIKFFCVTADVKQRVLCASGFVCVKGFEDNVFSLFLLLFFGLKFHLF